MPRTILFIQGGGEDVHDAWDQKLADSLQSGLGRGYTVRYPRMPNEADPRFAPWRDRLRREFEGLANGDLLVGHSIGAALLLHTLIQQSPPFTPGGLFLLAPPFIGEGGWESDEIAPCADMAARLPSGVPVRIYFGGEDAVVPKAHAGLYSQALPHAQVIQLEDADHQLDNDLSRVAADIRALHRG